MLDFDEKQENMSYQVENSVHAVIASDNERRGKGAFKISRFLSGSW